MSNVPLKTRIKADRIVIAWMIILIIGIATGMAFNTPKPVIQQQEYSFQQELNLEE